MKVKMLNRSRGQGMTEYIIIVGVIAIAAIGVFGFFGDVVKNQTAGMASELAGGSGVAAQGTAATQAGTAVTQAAVHNGLNNYQNNGQGGTAAGD